MITPERIERIKKEALASIGARAKNPKAPGISMVRVTPHEALAFVEAYTKAMEGDDDRPE